MNSLSWFLYFSEVVANVREMTGAILIAGAIMAALGVAFGPIAAMALDDSDIGTGWVRPTIKTVVIVWLCAGVLYIFAPSKNTMYAIAASEVGEKIVTSEKAQGIADDATKALHSWIKKQIEPPTKGRKSDD